MQISPDAPKRPALRYYGGGWLRSEWTISHFPAHDIYVEPCLGAASILLRKPAVMIEAVGDMDDRVVNFFTVLRSRAGELLEQINLTPWAEAELAACIPPATDPLEDARRFFSLCWMSVHGGPTAAYGSFRHQKTAANRYASPPMDIMGRVDLMDTARRLKSVQIFKRDAIDMIKKYLGTGALIYFDPPYLEATRARRRGYNHEMTAAYHRLAAGYLRQHDGPVVVAGYRSELYRRVYENYGWKRVEREYGTNGKTKAIECLWLSPVCQDRLASELHPTMRRDLRLFT